MVGSLISHAACFCVAPALNLLIHLNLIMHVASPNFPKVAKRRVSTSSTASTAPTSASPLPSPMGMKTIPRTPTTFEKSVFSSLMRAPAQIEKKSLTTLAAPLIRPSKPVIGATKVHKIDENTTIFVQDTQSAMTQLVRTADFETNSNLFSVNMPPLSTHWLDIGQLPAPLRNATHYLAATNFPRTFIRGRNAQHDLPPMDPSKPYTLVLDLDETLMHCSPHPPANGRPDCIVHFDPNRRGAVGYVQFRPFAKLLLEVASRDFTVVVFTASTKLYADQVIDALDPKNEFISLRLYRQHCTEVAGGFTKDLRTLERPLDRVILIDNSPVSVAMQPDHSVICSSFFGDAPEDKELVDLMLLLRELVETGKCVPDVCLQKYGVRRWINDLRGGNPI